MHIKIQQAIPSPPYYITANQHQMTSSVQWTDSSLALSLVWD